MADLVLDHITTYETDAGTRYRVRVYSRGKRIQESFSDLLEAIKRRDELLEAKGNGKKLERRVRQPGMSLTDYVMDVWWEEWARSNLSQRTRENYWRYFRDLVAKTPLGRTRIADITAEDIVLWERSAEAKASVSRVLEARKVISKALRYAAQTPRLTGVTANPSAAVEWPKQKRAREPEVFVPRVIERIRRKILKRRSSERQRRRDALVLSLIYLGGFRPMELRQLRVRDFSESRIRVPVGKNGKSRHIPYWPALKVEVSSYIEDYGLAPGDFLLATAGDGPWTADDYRNWTRRAYRQSRDLVADQLEDSEGERLRRATPYEVGRHTWIALRLAAGHNLAAIAQDAGHRLDTLAAHYAGVIAEYADGPAIDVDAEVAAARAEAMDER